MDRILFAAESLTMSSLFIPLSLTTINPPAHDPQPWNAPRRTYA
ncbi:hypothetical protein SF123566_3275 [Shigella flexneri 1235-66]|nr:hypothetical protein SF123566_3275 [Shigella flexneri 1235-66]